MTDEKAQQIFEKIDDSRIVEGVRSSNNYVDADVTMKGCLKKVAVKWRVIRYGQDYLSSVESRLVK